MTHQLLVSDHLAVPSINLPNVPAAQTSTLQPRTLEAMKTQYQLDQQVKFLSLQAETECLIQQLQALKQQRQLDSISISNQ